MSRHELPSKSGDHIVVVGWDRPLATFFAIVEQKAPLATEDIYLDEDAYDDDPVVLWIGTRYLELKQPEDLLVPLAPYAQLSAGMLEVLRSDRAGTLDTGPTALQRLVSRVFDQ